MIRRRFATIFLLLVLFSLLFVLALRSWLDAQGLTVGEFATEFRRGDEPRFTWRSIDSKHWQAAASGPEESAATTDAREGTSRGCPAGMVRVQGAFRQEANGASTGAIERLQDKACADWISRDFPARCRAYDAAKLAPEIAKVPTADLDFCIDRFEYPNVFGQHPMIVATFREAEAICAKEQKRLCSENEWTFACEGEEARPYPYGWTRDDTACVIDRPWRAFSEGALQPRDGAKAREELDRLWQGESSGSRPTCRSPFGVYDMTGNVDEWTRSVNPTGYVSILKGGYWGPVRARCRPATRAHNETFVAYQQGFRCCAASAEDEDVPPELVNDGGAETANDGGAEAASRDREREIAPAIDPDDDELASLARARGLRCATAFTKEDRSSAQVTVAFAALAALATARRRRRGP